MLMPVLITLAVIAAVLSPFALLGRRIERGRRAAAFSAVAEARASDDQRLTRPYLPPARPVTEAEEVETRTAAWLKLKEERFAEALDGLEARLQAEADRILQRAFDVLKLDTIDREWATLSTGELRVLLPA